MAKKGSNEPTAPKARRNRSEHAGKIPYATAKRNFTKEELEEMIRRGKVAPDPTVKSTGNDLLDAAIAKAREEIDSYCEKNLVFAANKVRLRLQVVAWKDAPVGAGVPSEG